jgi:predicted nuclease of predicted toxin-antitoxin system
MNLLFDQNISFRIIKLIIDVFPGARQVRELQLENSTDLDIWTYAKSNQYCIVTFDADFIDLSNLKGHPPKVIWLRLGNTSTKFIAEKILGDHQIIREFISNDEDAFLEMNKEM